jgi:hypothetical protein
LLYTLELEDMQDAYNGFEQGRKYPCNVGELIAALDWAVTVITGG